MIYHNLVYDQFTMLDIKQHEIAYSSFTCGPSTSKPTFVTFLLAAFLST